MPAPDLTIKDVRAAAARIEGLVRRTPVLTCPALNARTGARIWIKPENLQETGSFKLRGASNFIARRSDAELANGVVAYSSGNHAQGVSRAARRGGLSATIVMPSDAPRVKLDGVRSDGADIVLYDRQTESREAIAAEISARTGAVLIPSYDHADILCGQGTAGLELFEDLQAQRRSLDGLVCCVGGGGLIAGIGLAYRGGFSPQGEIWGAEPLGFDDHKRSLAARQRVANPPGGSSLCDSLMTPEPGEVTFEINCRQLIGVFAVSDDEVMDAMRFAFREMKLVLEPGGAAALAAVLHHAPKHWFGRDIGLVLTGGNVDPDLFARVLRSDESVRRSIHSRRQGVQ